MNNHGGSRMNSGRKKSVTDKDRLNLKMLIDEVVTDDMVKGIFLKMVQSQDWKQWQLVLFYKYGRPVDYYNPISSDPIGPVFGLRELLAEYKKKYESNSK